MPMNDARHKIVYFADKSLHIVPEDEYRAADFADERTRVWSDADGELSPANIVKFFERYDRAVFIAPRSPRGADEAFEELASRFKRVPAAGGIVADSDGEVVMIRRNDRWDLPKGHIEAGESPEACAVREVGEETGADGAKIAAFLCNTIHAYDVYGVWELKTTYWYLLATDCRSELTPQRSEGIERAEWCDARTTERNLRNAYPTIRKVFAEYEKIKEKIW